MTEDLMPSAVLVLAWLALMRAARTSGWSVAIVGMLGTIFHEASHYVIGLLLGAKPVSVSLWPKRQGNYWVLGSVGFERITLWNAAPVAFAPLLLIGVAWLLLAYVVLPTYSAGHYAGWFVGGYAVACCLSSCLPSLTDIRVGFLSAMLYGGVGYFFWSLSA